MRVIHVLEDASMAGSGVATFVMNSARLLTRIGIPVHVIAAGSDSIAFPSEVRVDLAPVPRFGRPHRWSPVLGDELAAAIGDYRDVVVHIHGLWKAPQLVAARTARSLGVPVLISAHGMLQPRLWRMGSRAQGVKKALYWQLVNTHGFRGATFHAVTEDERTAIRRLGAEAVVLPSCIDLEGVDRIVADLPGPDPTASRDVLFLGRLHKVKNVGGLIAAFAEAANWKDRLVIAGPHEDADYVAELKRTVKEHGLAGRVNFLGAVSGIEKWALIRAAWIAAMPSHTEVLGYANLEAAACQTPSISASSSGLAEEWASANLVVSDQTELTSAVRAALRWNADERRRRGSAARRVVEELYSAEKLGPAWAQLYESLIKKGTT